MRTLGNLFDNNRNWAANMLAKDPEFFAHLARQQRPDYLWIGCSDSRVPANEIVGLPPGELFVHRNIANVVVHTDLNCLSVMQFAVDILKVRNIIVTGHYGCSGVAAVVQRRRIGLSDNWLRHVEDVRQKHAHYFPQPGETSADSPALINRLCELNVIEQVLNVCQTTIVKDAWERQQPLSIHGWIYGLNNGLLRDLNTTITQPDEVVPMYNSALAGLTRE